MSNHKAYLQRKRIGEQSTLQLTLHKEEMIIQYVPLATEPGISLIIFTTNEDIAAITDTHYRHIPLHFSHNERTPVKISLQYLHWC